MPSSKFELDSDIASLFKDLEKVASTTQVTAPHVPKIQSEDFTELFSGLNDAHEEAKIEVELKLSSDEKDKLEAFSNLVETFDEIIQPEPEILPEVIQEKVVEPIDESGKLQALEQLFSELVEPEPVVEMVETPKEIVVDEIKVEALIEEPTIVEKKADLVDKAIAHLDGMQEKTELKEEVAQIATLRKEFDNFRSLIAQQISSTQMSGAGGGEVRLEFLDDVNRASSTVDGKFLQYQASSGKFIGADASGGSSAADDLTAGDAAVTLTTSSGNITIDAAANNSDIIFKGTDGGSDITMLTLDGSADGAAAFKSTVTATGIIIGSTAVTSTAAELNILDGVTSTATELNFLDGSTANSVVNSKAVVYGSSGELAGTLSTVAQTNVTSLGTLTALTIDNVVINGSTIGHSDDTDLITVADGIVTVAGEVQMTTLDIGGTNVTSTAAELNALDGITAVVGELNALDIGTTAIGTAVASKAVILDSSKDYSGIRNLTVSGELDAATGDFSGAVDIAGDLTLSAGADGALTFGSASSVKFGDNNAASLVFEEADNAYMTFVTTNSSEAVKFDKALDINAAVQIDATLTVGVDDTGYDFKLFGATSGAHILWDASDDALETAGGATINIIKDKLKIAGTAVTTTAAELNFLDTASANSVVNSKAVIYGSSGELAGLLSTAAQTNVTSLGTLTALTVDDVAVNGKVITMTGSSNDTAVFTAEANGALSIVTTDAGGAAGNIQITADGTAELAGTTVTLDSSGNIVLDADGGTITFADASSSLGTITSSGYSGTAAVATTVTITDNEDTNEENVLVFVAGADADGGNVGLESDGNLKYNPSTGTLSVTNMVVSGTQTIVDSVTMNASNAVIFEGSTADAHETTLTTIDATGDRTISLPNVSGTIPVLAAASATAITSTPAELNKLDGATVVVGEINALDLGSTAVGTAIASKAVILDSSKDYAGIRNLTISGEIDAATGDYSGAVDIAGATTTAAITASGIIKTDDSTAATSTTDGSLQTDGGLSVVLDAVIGDDLLMLSDASVIHFGADSDVTLTHVADTGLLLNGTSVIQFNDASQNIGAPSNAILDINATDEVEINATLIDVNGNLDVSGTGVIAGAVTTAALTASGIIKTDDTTAATSTTDGSLQTDGGLSVAADAIIGDDVKLLSDSAVLSFGADAEVTLTHVHNDGLLLNTDMQLQFRDSAINIRSDADGDLDINADDEIELNSTLIDINGNVEISGTLAQADAITMATNKKIIFRDAAIHISSTADGDLSIAADDEIDITSTLIDINGNVEISGTAAIVGIATFTDDIIIGDGKTIGSASDVDAMTIASNGQVTFTQTLIGTALDISGDIDVDGTANLDVVDIDGAVDMASTLAVAGATTTAALTASGIIKTDDNTAATSTTDGSLQTDGGLSVVLDAVIGDDLFLLSDAAVLNFGADSDVKLTHVADTGLLLNGTSVIQFNDASQSIGAPSNAILDINATDEIELNATLIDVNGNLDVSGTGVIAGVLTANAGVVVDELTIDADTITATDDFIIDAAGDITLDAGGGDVNFADDGTGFAFIARTGNNVIFGNPVSDGNILIQGSDGGTGQVYIEINPGVNEGVYAFHANGAGSSGNQLGLTLFNQTNGPTLSQNTSASSFEFQTFRNNGTQKGAIVGSANATAYQTSSDYRLKQNVNYSWDATTECKKLKPCRFKWIGDVAIEDGGGDAAPIVTGFLAHELQAVVPDAAFGVKDATETYINDDGDSATRIKPQGIDQSKIISILTKTIQELEARITAGGL